MAGNSLVRGIFAGAPGIGAEGVDPMTIQDRFVFGIDGLSRGIAFVAVVIGLFGVSEALT